MTQPQSRARRQAAFMEEAKRMYDQMEEWTMHIRRQVLERLEQKHVSEDES